MTQIFKHVNEYFLDLVMKKIIKENNAIKFYYNDGTEEVFIKIPHNKFYDDWVTFDSKYGDKNYELVGPAEETDIKELTKQYLLLESEWGIHGQPLEMYCAKFKPEYLNKKFNIEKYLKEKFNYEKLGGHKITTRKNTTRKITSCKKPIAKKVIRRKIKKN